MSYKATFNEVGYAGYVYSGLRNCYRAKQPESLTKLKFNKKTVTVDDSMYSELEKATEKMNPKIKGPLHNDEFFVHVKKN